MFSLSLADIENIDFGVVTNNGLPVFGQTRLSLYFNVKWIGAASGTEMTHLMFLMPFIGKMWQRFIICVAVFICKYVSVYNFCTFKLDI